MREELIKFKINKNITIYLIITLSSDKNRNKI